MVTTDASGQVPADKAVEADAVLGLLDRLARQRVRLLNVIGTLSEEELDRPPEPGAWTARQQLAHLAEMEGMWLSWALSIAYAPECQIGERGQSPTPSIQAAHTRSTQELLVSLEKRRQRTIEAVAGLTPRQLARRGYHRWFGPLTTLQCLRAIYRHDRVHTEQILRQPSSIRMPDQPDPAETEGWFTITRRVAWADTDASRAWTSTAPQRYAEEAEVAFVTDAGVLDLLYPHLPRVYIEARYAAPAYFNQEIDVDLALTRLGRSSLHFVFRVLRGATLCAAGRMGSACVGHDGRAAPLPGEARAALAPRLRPEKDRPWA